MNWSGSSKMRIGNDRTTEVSPTARPGVAGNQSVALFVPLGYSLLLTTAGQWILTTLPVWLHVRRDLADAAHPIWLHSDAAITAVALFLLAMPLFAHAVTAIWREPARPSMRMS